MLLPLILLLRFILRLSLICYFVNSVTSVVSSAMPAISAIIN